MVHIPANAQCIGEPYVVSQTVERLFASINKKHLLNFEEEDILIILFQFVNYFLCEAKKPTAVSEN